MAATNRDIIALFWSHLRRHRLAAFLILLGVTVANVAEVIAPLFYKTFFDTLSASPSSEQAVPELTGLLLVIMGVHMAGWTFWRLSGFFMDWLQPKISADLERDAFSYLTRHSYKFFSNNFAGALVRKVSRLSRSFEHFTDSIIYKLLPLAVTTIGMMVVLWSQQPVFAIIIAVWMALFIWVNYLVSKWKLRYDLLRAQRDSEAVGVLSDAVANSVTVKLFAGYTQEETLFGRATEALRRLRTFCNNLVELNNAVQHFFMIAVELIVMYVALQYWAAGTITLGDFVLVQGLLIALFNKLWDFGRLIRDLYESMADSKEMVDILQEPHEIRDLRSAKHLQVTRGKIVFENAAFAYNKTRYVLQDFNLTIKPREKVALVGPSGAGKSTVIKLLLRLYELDDGDVLIDDQSTYRVTQDSLREAIAVVPQEPVLFHRTLMENIRYGRRDATDEEVIAAAQQAHCHEFIMELPEGYNTYVGERGIKLSGGERQRVAVARAILKDAPILVLDEATSALDSESEALIQDALADLMKKKTTIVIAHRLSTIMQMDRIVVIEGGRVSASGTHQDLLKKNGTYKKLWKIQAGGFIP